VNEHSFLAKTRPRVQRETAPDRFGNG
jgi:hypothetical protein